MKLLYVICSIFIMAMDGIEGNNPVWSVIPGRLMQVDVSSADVVWGVNSSHFIFLRVGSQGKWKQIGGLLKHVSVGEAGVWGVNKHDEIWYREGVSSSNVAGTKWKKVDGLLKQIDSGPPGIVYGVNRGDNIYCRTGITTSRPQGESWKILDRKLKYISCGVLGCWGVNANDDIFFRVGVTPGKCEGTKWEHIRSGKLKQVEVSSGGVVLGVNSANQLYARVGITAANPTGTKWVKIPSPRFKHVSAGKSAIWAINAADYIFYYDVLAPSWARIGGKLRELDVSPSDVVWGVNSEHSIYIRLGTRWEKVTGGLKHVSVGNAGVWGVNQFDHIYFREGITTSNLPGTKWNRISGLLKQIDSGPPGIVYGVNRGDDIYCRTGITTSRPQGSGWKILDGKLKYISCGVLGCWGVNANDDIFFRVGVTPGKCEGTKWEHIRSGKLKQIEVTSDGKVYGVTSGRTMFVRLGITPNNPTGTVWKVVISPPFKHVSAGDSAIWGLDLADNIYYFIGLEFREENYAILLTDNFPKGGIGKIAVRNPVSGVKYSLTTASSIVEIDSNTGQLTLLVNADQQHRSKVNNSRFEIQAQLGSEVRTVGVVIYLLPLSHGDPLALPAMTAVKKGLEASQSITLNYGPAAEISPELLDRSLKQVSPDDPASQLSEAQARVERAIDLVKSIIIHAFEKDYGRGAVLGFFHNQQLFSTAIISKLDRESDCHETVKHIVCPQNVKYRRSDGKCSNLNFPLAGAAGTPYVRLLPAKYYDVDGLNDPIGYPNQPNAPPIPSPFIVSRDLIRDEIASSNSAARNLTPAVMQFGQFLDHDLDLSAGGEGSTACLSIRCDGSADDFLPPCYPILPLENNEPPCMRFVRSAAMCQLQGFPTEREQINDITGVIDGNNVYGSSESTTRSLRDLQNDVGLMRVSQMNGEDLLPEDPDTTTCIQGCFKAGDIRANEQQGLTSFHTLFLREHNRIARILKQLNAHWNGETVFQETRKIVGAILQKIVYEDYLPIILGPNALTSYAGHNQNIDPSISNAFAAAAYRFGHSTIRSKFDLLNASYEEVAPAMKLRFMFFNNTVTKTMGVEPVLFGLIGNVSEKVDTVLSREITKHLFERGNQHGENLAALNLQRSRDHGLPGYNEFRVYCGLSNASTFEDTRNEIRDSTNRAILRNLYNDDPNLVELWMAGLAEVPFQGATVGPTLRCVIREQFQRSRDGDRFFYKNLGVFSSSQVLEIKKTSLSRLYCDNVNGIVSIQRNAFLSAVNEVRPSCQQILGMSLCQWKECNNGQPHFNQATNLCECM